MGESARQPARGSGAGLVSRVAVVSRLMALDGRGELTTAHVRLVAGHIQRVWLASRFTPSAVYRWTRESGWAVLEVPEVLHGATVAIT